MRSLPLRYTALGLAVLGLLLSLLSVLALDSGAGMALIFGLLVALGGARSAPDAPLHRCATTQSWAICGLLLEFIRPEIRQYFIESDNEAAPFSRAQRSLVYQRAKGEPDKRPVRHRSWTCTPWAMSGSTTRWRPARWPATTSASPIGGNGCTQPYSASVFNISAMSFGALSAPTPSWR
jgi:hypothetical protein